MTKYLTALLLAACLAGCAASNDKQSIQFTDGTVKTVYGVDKNETSVSYYNTKEDAKELKNQVTVPLVSIKQITDLSDE